MGDQIQIALNSVQALALMNTVNVRLQMLAAKEQLTASEHIEFYALQAVALKVKKLVEEL
jgi:hypothetical protein